MKKLMIAAAIVCAAVISQAAAVSWSTGTFSNGFAGPDGKTMKNLETYTAVCTFFSDAAGKVEDVVTTSSLAKGKTNGSYGGTTDDLFSGETTYYAQIVISGKDADGKEWTRSTNIAAFDVPATGTPSLNFYAGDGIKGGGNQWGEWQSVPEPTSGMLLLLGVAGLALRRRRA